MIKIGQVVQLVGEATVVGANGVERALVGGDVLYSDDVINTGANGAVVVEFSDGSRLDLGRNATVALDSEVFDVHRLAQVQDAVISAKALQDMIAAGVDPTAVAEEPAAGEETLEESAESGVQIDRTGDLGEVTSGFETRGIGAGAAEQPQIVDDSSLLFLAALPPTIDLDANDSSGAVGTGYNGAFVEDGESVPIADEDTLIKNPHGDSLEGATITLTNAAPNDALSVGDLPPGIQAEIDTSEDGQIVVRLSGEATLADYQEAIEAIRFHNDSDAPDTTDRVIHIQVFDASTQSDVAVSTIQVTAVNDPPLAVDDAGSTDENQLLVLDVLANDQDPDETDTLTLTDVNIVDGGGTVRIEDGQLVFDPGEDFDELAEGESAEVLIEYAVTDSAGATGTGVATITVTGSNDAPIIHTNTPYTHADIRETSSAFVEDDPKRVLPQLEGESQTVDPALINGLGIIEMAETREVVVKFNWSGGVYDNVLGWYRIGEDGEIIDPQVVWENTDAKEHGREGVRAVSLGELEEGTRIGFFLISDGAADLPGDDSPLEFRHQNGQPATIYDNGAEIGLYVEGNDSPITQQPIFHTAANALHDNLDLNPDGLQHVISSPSRSGSHMVIGFEDLLGEGDKDFNDLVFRVFLSQPTVAQHSSGMERIRLSVEDPDSAILSQAEIRIAEGFQAGDELLLGHGFTVDPDDFSLRGWEGEDTGLKVQGGGFDSGTGTLTIVGEGSISLYEEVLNAVRLQTDGSEDSVGTRIIDYTVTDDMGLTSEVASIALNLTADNVMGTAGDDILTGTNTNDRLFGSLGDDQIDAGSGDDILIGGEGVDLLSGGAGADLFVYRCNEAGTDLITDYSAAEGDVLDISTVLSGVGIDADNIDQYVQLTPDGELFVDKTGSGQFDGEAIASLEGIGSGDDVTLLLDTGMVTITGM